MNGKYDVLDVARYIINYSAEEENWVSNLKLQKLLYFVQAFFLLEHDEPCFSENIEAWRWGPVVPEVYQEFKNNGALPISKIDVIFEGDWKERKRKFKPEDIFNEIYMENINGVVDLFGQYSANDLVDITHNQDPWKIAIKKGTNSIIKKRDIKKFFEQK